VERRFVLFIVLSMAVLIGNFLFQAWLRGKQPPQPVAQQKIEEKKADEKKDEKKPAQQQPADKENNQAKPADEKVAAAAEAAPADAAEAPEPKPEWFTLGSADPSENNRYRLLVTFSNQGAAVERIELSNARFRDLEDRSGYLGHLAAEDTPGGDGVKINVVGAGTPADVAQMHPGDVITQIDTTPIVDAAQFVKVLSGTRPDQKIEISIRRNGNPLSLTATLGRRPLEVVRPEAMRKGKEEIPEPLSIVSSAGHDPFSYLLTLWQVDDHKLADDAALDAELPGVNLRSVHWETEKAGDTVKFTRDLKKLGLRVIKTYTIAKPQGDQPGYHLTLKIEIQNIGETARKVAYQLDGPTGLPTEGWWYATRIARDWGGAGLRNTALLLQDKSPALISPMAIAAGKIDPPYRQEEPDTLLAYAGVDAQYFASALLPEPFKNREPWLAQIKPILVGKVPDDPKFKTMGDVSCRLISFTKTLQPNDEPLTHTYTVFAGPKKPELLAQYPLADPNTGFTGDPQNNLGELIYYGWPIWAAVARPMTHILHFFYSIVGNYGIAIIMLTVLVRGCMFPLSRKQALGAQKMQELKPEMDRINEKYKGKPEDKTRAMQELWRKHNYNPMSGCLLAFLQLPIFIGLYRALMINVELRQAPLISESIRWCSNLAAPDMLAFWRDWSFMPSFLTAYKGFMSLGPFLNILPLFTVGLFILQQQMFMPPATDDQTRMQQKMMKYMMVVVGYMFYTVPSGLCLYIIASSLWGITEKKLLPKAKTAAAGAPSTTSKLTKLFSPDSNGSAADKRERKKQRRGK
jgi:YidC/Oxa1 family membrane protein insertase